MKTTNSILACFSFTTGALWIAAAAPQPGATPPIVVERGPHHRVWERTVTEASPTGQLISRAHRYVELQTGMNYWREGAWRESRDEIEVFPGGAIARQGPIQVIFAPNINTAGAIDLVAPDGQRFRSHVLGLAYTDEASGKSVMIAEIQDAAGEVLTPPNQVIYRNAFSEIKADVRYTYTKSGFEQDIILRENLPPPAAFGLNPNTTRLECYSEFIEAPAATVSAMVVREETDPEARAAMAEPDLVDEQVDFGSLHFGPGFAFPLGTVDRFGADAVPTGKRWEMREGRQLLIEKVEYFQIAPQLEALPKSAAIRSGTGEMLMAKGGNGQTAAGGSWLPKAPPVRTEKTPLQLAQVRPSEPGYVLDYQAVTTTTNFTFQGDTTYCISGGVTLSGTTIIEGGTVVKFATTGGITYQGPIQCRTSSYWPAIFTAKDDDTVGEVIAGSSGTPSGPAYGNHFALNSIGTAFALHDVRSRYAQYGFSIYNSVTSLDLAHAQLGYCGTAIRTYKPVTLRNVLVHDQDKALWGYLYREQVGEHLTAHRVNTLLYGQGLLGLTNALLAAVTNVGNVAASHVATNLNDAGVFQTVGAGARYLADTNACRDAGTTNISAELLLAIKHRTTWPPTVVTGTLTSSTIWTAHVPRDTDVPDLGYHYDALDYLVDGLTVTNATLLVTNGAAVAMDAACSGAGLRLDDGASLISEGGPTQLNRFVRTHGVQELPWGNCTNGAPMLADVYPTTSPPTAYFRFTRFPMLPGTYLLRQPYEAGGLSALVLRDSQIHGGQLLVAPGATNSVLAVTNTLWERVTAYVDAVVPTTLELRNNLFYDGLLNLAGTAGGSWSATDNLFDRTSVSIDGSETLTHDYNGYVTGYSRFSPNGTNDVVLTNSPLDYVAGPLGDFYYPTNGGLLSTLIDAGSTDATNVGLYHFTTITNQTKEADSQLDIGYHYVAVTNIAGVWLPVDSDGDTLPDYWEDRNGNGAHDLGETDWQTYNSNNGLTGQPGLEVFTPLK